MPVCDSDSEEVHPHQKIGHGQIPQVQGMYHVIRGGDQPPHQDDQITGAPDSPHDPHAEPKLCLNEKPKQRDSPGSEKGVV